MGRCKGDIHRFSSLCLAGPCCDDRPRVIAGARFIRILASVLMSLLFHDNRHRGNGNTIRRRRIAQRADGEPRHELAAPRGRRRPMMRGKVGVARCAAALARRRSRVEAAVPLEAMVQGSRVEEYLQEPPAAIMRHIMRHRPHRHNAAQALGRRWQRHPVADLRPEAAAALPAGQRTTSRLYPPQPNLYGGDALLAKNAETSLESPIDARSKCGSRF